MVLCFLATSVHLMAQDHWQVPAVPLPLEISFAGEVVPDTARRETLLPYSTKCSIAWLAMPGGRVEAGDPIVVFDTAPIAVGIPDLDARVTVAERTLARDVLAQQNAMAALEDIRGELEVELQVEDATIAALMHPEPARLALLKSMVEQIDRQVQDLERQVRRLEPLHEAGLVSGVEMQDRRDRLTRLRFNRRGPQAEFDRFNAGPDAVQLAFRQSKRAAILAKLGRDDQGRVLPQAGILARIAALQAQGEREKATNRLELEQARRNRHRAERDVRDHTPLQGIEIQSLAAGAAVRRWTFAPVGTPPVPDWTMDHGACFDAQRGHGWAHDMTSRFVSRHQKPELGAGIALLSDRAAWRVALPDGEYRITLTLGDEREWDGAVARLRLKNRDLPAFYVAKRIEAKQRRTAATVAMVQGGFLELVFGGAEGKALRAPRDGVVTIPSWIRLGAKVVEDDWPVAYFNDPRQFQVRGRVLQSLGGFLAPKLIAGPSPALNLDPQAVSRIATLTALRAWSATNEAQIVTRDGRCFSAAVVQRSSQAVTANATTDWGRADPLDRIANEVLLQPPEDQARHLVFGEQVTVQARPRLGTGMTVVPSWLVARRDGRCWIRRAGMPAEEVVGMSAGGRVALSVTLAPGTRLEPASAPVADTATVPSFPGEVVADLRTPITVPYYWGRIADMAEEGSTVTAGQVVIRLVNPELERSREDRQQEKSATRERYLLSNDKRRVQTLEGEEKVRLQRVDEVVSRVEVVKTQQRDPVAEARAAARFDDAGVARSMAERRQSALAATLGTPPAKIATAQRQEQQAACDARSAAIAQASAQRSVDWLAHQSALSTWDEARSLLDLREGRMLLAARQEQIAAQTAALGLTAALDRNREERIFENIRQLRTPVGGRIFFLTGWDDQTGGPAKFRHDMVVWGGVTVAEVLDLSRLRVRCELPEDRLNRVKPGQALTVVLPQLGGRRIVGTVSEVGRCLLPPREAAADRGTGRVIAERAFTVTVAFQPPADLKDVLIPGTKAMVEVP